MGHRKAPLADGETAQVPAKSNSMSIETPLSNPKRKKGKEWKVTFKDPAAKDKAKETLYMATLRARGRFGHPRKADGGFLDVEF